MAFVWPEFPNPIALTAMQSWTAAFDSYDQRNDDCYYRVILYDRDHVTHDFMVQIGLWWAGDDWTSDGFSMRLMQELTNVAATGRTNTQYIGSRK